MNHHSEASAQADGIWVGPKVNPLWDTAAAKAEFGGQTVELPRSAADITADVLNRLIAPMWPDVKVARVQIVDAKTWGTDEGLVSTSNRIKMRLRYAEGSKHANSLPNDVILKFARRDIQIGPLYANEIRIYQKLSKEIGIETPFCIGALFDPETQTFAMLLGDLVEQGAKFPNVLDDITETHITSLIDTLAKLHARYWNSPRFKTDLSVLQDHVNSTLAQFMDYSTAPGCLEGIKNDRFKRELVEYLDLTPEEMIRGTKAVQLHQSRLPQTLCHGDCHLGNTYIHADGRVGLCDFQLSVRGFCMHDVHYIIITALSPAQRRKLERKLLTYYLEKLKAYGVESPPTFDSIWTEYRRAVIWGFWIGWVVTPISNYGWEINVVNHIRLAAAFRDLETRKLVKELL